ncbi:MAG: hypothetical protein KAQ85_02355 [Thermodesulfovibrionia bacterium]|nr:hypothetical protein [Thermodesulfovibrionia bacterium]
MLHGKRGFVLEKECERFCHGTVEVLKKIHDRVAEEQSKKQRKKKKTSTLVASD